MNARWKAWAVLVAVFAASIAVSANRFKVAPVMQTLMAELQADMVTGGWFMSIFSVAAIVLAIPAAFLVARLGVRVTGLIALGCAVAGAAVGALARDVPALLLSRLIEGIGVGLMAVVAPAAISLWFEPQDRGLPMGIWAAWVPVGNVIIFNAAHPLLASFGWRGVWWFGALLVLAAMAAFALVVTPPPGPGTRENAGQGNPGHGAPEATVGSFARHLLNVDSWLLGLAFGMFGFGVIGYNTWAPAYLVDTLHLELATANFYASLMFLAAIPGSLFAGWLINRTGKRFGLMIGAFLVTAILLLVSFRLGSVAVVVPYMLLLGFVSNLIPTPEFTLAPETMDSLAYAGLGLAILLMVGNTGSLAGPPVLASVLNGGDWAAGSTFLAAVMGLGLLVAILASRRMKVP